MVTLVLNEQKFQSSGGNVMTKIDMVNHPQHYNQGSFECIDVMEEIFGKACVENFCKCNAFKYIWRCDKKNGSQDIEKAIWYLNKILELNKGGNKPC